MDVDVPTSSTSHSSDDAANTSHVDTVTPPVSVTPRVSAVSSTPTSIAAQSDDPMSTACRDEASSAVIHNVAVDSAVGNNSAAMKRPQFATNDVTCQTTEATVLARELLSQLKTAGIPDETMISIPKGLLQQLLELGKNLP